MAKVGTKVGTKCRVLTEIPLQHWHHLLMAEQLSTLETGVHLLYKQGVNRPKAQLQLGKSFSHCWK